MSAELGYIIDLDGTIYRGEHLLPHAKEFISWLNKMNITYRFFTNCSSKTPEQVNRKLKKMGIIVSSNQIVTSGCLAEKYILDCEDRKIFFIGSPSFCQSLIASGVTVVKGVEEPADFVVVGFSTDFNYRLLSHACWHLQNGAAFLATNLDATIPVRDGQHPHTGPVCAYLQYATNKNIINLGKPDTYSGQYFRHIFGDKKIIVIGDRLDTDMQFALNNDFTGHLVLTGSTKADDLSPQQQALFPTFNSLREIINLYQESV